MHGLPGYASSPCQFMVRVTVKMRRRVRGLRALERRVLEDRRHGAAPEPPRPHEPSKPAATSLAAASDMAPSEPCGSSNLGVVCPNRALEAVGATAAEAPPVEDEVGAVVLGY